MTGECMLDVLQETSHHPHWTLIRLNTGFQGDLAWWSAFVRPWNGVSYIPQTPTVHHSDVHLMPHDHGAMGHGFGHCGFRSPGTHSPLS